MPVAQLLRRGLSLIAAFPFILIAEAASGQSPLDLVLKTVPPDAQAAIIVPHLKVLSDQLTQCLEGMDRANLLMGSRPLDQMKSAAGFNAGVDDLGGAAWVIPGGPAEAKPVFIVPVSDPKTFLEASFVSHEGDAWKRADGSVVFAKALEKHVVLGPDAAIVKAWAPGEGLGPWLKNQMGERGGVVMYAGEALLFARGGAIGRFMRDAEKAAPPGVPMAPGMNQMAGAFDDSLEAAVVTLDFDPLGLIARSYARFKADSVVGQAAAGGANAGRGLASLPGKPFYFAGSIDVEGLGGAEAFKRLAAALALPEPPAWVLQARNVEFAAYPSPAGLAGGLLNDAMAILRTADPAGAKAFIKQQIIATKDLPDGVKREVAWQDDKPLKDGLKADAYEVKVTDAPPGHEQQQIASSLIFGSAGWRGFVRQLDDGVLMTFSQRPAVLQAALAAAAAKPDAGGTLASNGAVKMMRQWMPPHCDVEGYLGVGPLGQAVKQMAESLPMLGEARLPEFDESLPPIGFGLEINDHGAESSTIVPAGVLAMMFDAVMKQGAAAPVGPGAQGHP